MAVAITVDVEVASAVAVAVSPVEVAVSFSFADDRRCLIRESSSSFFTDLSLGGLELTWSTVSDFRNLAPNFELFGSSFFLFPIAPILYFQYSKK